MNKTRLLTLTFFFSFIYTASSQANQSMYSSKRVKKILKGKEVHAILAKTEQRIQHKKCLKKKSVECRELLHLASSLSILNPTTVLKAELYLSLILKNYFAHGTKGPQEEFQKLTSLLNLGTIKNINQELFTAKQYLSSGHQHMIKNKDRLIQYWGFERFSLLSTGFFDVAFENSLLIKNKKNLRSQLLILDNIKIKAKTPMSLIRLKTLRAKATYELGDPKKALQLINEASATIGNPGLNPIFLETVYAQALLHFKSGHLKLALKAIKKINDPYLVLRKKGADFNTIALQGVIMYEMGNKKAACTYLKEYESVLDQSYLSTNNDFAPFLEKCSLHVKNKILPEGEIEVIKLYLSKTLYEEMIKNKEADLEALNFWGDVCERTKIGNVCSTVAYGYVEYFNDLKKGLTYSKLGCSNDDAMSCYNAGCYKARTKKFKEAFLFLKKTLDLKPEMKEMISSDQDLLEFNKTHYYNKL